MPEMRTPEERARHRADEWMGLMWHISAYVVVNAFLWVIDLVTVDGLQWAYWVTIAWGIGVLFHVASYVIETGEFAERKYERFLEQERSRDDHPAHR